MRDVQKNDDPQIIAVLDLLADLKPDILVLQGFDADYDNSALGLFARALADRDVPLHHLYAPRSNAGLRSGLDLNGNGALGDAADAQGFGRFSGQGAMALLSRYPIDLSAAQDFSDFLWRDLPDTLYPMTPDGPFAGDRVFDTQRLSSHGHWVVPIALPDGTVLTVLTYHATPPVFDGPEDRNGRRNHDETAFWLHFLDGAFTPPPTDHFVLLGDANIDPERGEGRKGAIHQLLNDPRLQTPFDNTPTADWRDPMPGDMRVDYLMPSADWRIIDYGIVTNPVASRHSLLWADLEPRDP